MTSGILSNRKSLNLTTFQRSQSQSKKPHTDSLILGTSNLISGISYLDLGSCYSILGLCYLILGLYCLI
jgi:hypothetical protein